MFPRPLILAALVLLPSALPAWDPDWFRHTNPDLDYSLQEHDERTRDLVEITRERSERARAEAARLAAMEPAERHTFLKEEFDRWAAAWPGHPVGLEAAFPTEALGRFVAEFPGDGTAVIRNASTGRGHGALSTGDTFPIEYEDVSLVHMLIGKVDEENARAEFLLGDGQWWLHGDGTVEAPTAESLTRRHLDLLSRWDPDGPLVNTHLDAMPLTATASLILRRAGRDPGLLRRVGVFPERSFPQRLAARPMEMQLSLAYLSYGTADGIGVVWEHGSAGETLLRPFPVVDQAVNLLPPPHRLLSLSGDGTSAEILVGEEVHDVMIFDYVRLPLIGAGFAEGIVGSIDSNFNEVVVECAGRGIVFTRLPEELAGLEVYISDASRFDVYFRPLRRATGMEFVVDPSIAEMEIRATQGRRPLGEALEELCRRHGVAWRWRDSETLVFGTTEALGAPDFRSP